MLSRWGRLSAFAFARLGAACGDAPTPPVLGSTTTASSTSSAAGTGSTGSGGAGGASSGAGTGAGGGGPVGAAFDLMAWNLEQFPHTTAAPGAVAGVLAERAPAVVAVEEVDDIGAFQALAAAVPGYVATVASQRNE